MDFGGAEPLREVGGEPCFGTAGPAAFPAPFACIVGAPRCGTTSLAAFLGDHPDVQFSVVKEPHFFAQHDLTRLADDPLVPIVRHHYLGRFFPGWAANGRLLAEGSVSYLYRPERMAPILRLWPDARFIIALRDPFEMLPSLHRRLLYIGDETEPEFERAWALTGARAMGQHIPRTCIDARVLQYRQIGRLGAHVERFFGAVGRERCFVALMDDLASDPEALHRRLLTFLGLPYAPRRDFAPHRPSYACRLPWLQRLLKRPPAATRAFLAGEKFRHRVRSLEASSTPPVWARAVFAGRKRLLDWNRLPAPPVQISPALQREMRATFAGDVALLERLIGRDLGH